MHCQQDTKARRRDFSEQTWTVLLVWGEIDSKTVDQPICEPCYNELRYVLIDRFGIDFAPDQEDGPSLL
ncbi:MAG: hypothetical protein EBU49_11445 [Proteobacteria bacterium]|nr:hypothetical protein [Pseudomonadota bacterium]